SGLFFFQAADGIRDFHVTGVQTCALPIFEKMQFVRDTLSRQMTRGDKALAVYYANILSGVKTHLRNLFGSGANIAFRELSLAPRSEERRVGKECRYRSSPRQKVR